jgi:hypothetical protein
VRAGAAARGLELTVPDLPVDQSGFTRCVDGKLTSWVGATDADEEGDAFYGYTGPGYREEFWILDVEGTRLMIAGERSAGSPQKALIESSNAPFWTQSGSSHDASFTPHGSKVICAAAGRVLESAVGNRVRLGRPTGRGSCT